MKYFQLLFLPYSLPMITLKHDEILLHVFKMHYLGVNM